MKMQFVDEKGALNGWVVSGAFTLMTMVFLALGFLVLKIGDAWVKIGSTYTTIYLASMGIWFGYKTIKSFTGGGITTEQKP